MSFPLRLAYTKGLSWNHIHLLTSSPEQVLDQLAGHLATPVVVSPA